MDSQIGYELLSRFHIESAEKLVRERLGRALQAYQAGDYEMAVELAQTAEQAAAESADRIGQAAALMYESLAWAQNADGREELFAMAVQACEKAREIYGRHSGRGPNQDEMTATEALGWLYQSYRDSLAGLRRELEAKAVGYYEESLALFQKVMDHYAALGDNDRIPHLQRVCQDIRRRFTGEGRTHIGSDFLKRLTTDSFQEPICECLQESIWACERDDDQDMLKLARECTRVARQCNSLVGEAAAFVHVGVAHARRKEYDEAVAACEKAKRIYGRDPHWQQRLNQAVAAEGLGLICQDHADHLVARVEEGGDQARAYYHEALDLLDRARDYYQRAGDQQRVESLGTVIERIRERLDDL